MASRQQPGTRLSDSPPSRADGGSRRPEFLPTANPPRKNLAQVAIAATLFGAWLIFLAYLALAD